MKLPEAIRLKIEKSADKEHILLLLARLESDGVAITPDVYTAIVATLEAPKPQLCRARGQTSERFQRFAIDLPDLGNLMVTSWVAHPYGIRPWKCLSTRSLQPAR
jgi:hypothetical protein